MNKWTVETTCMLTSNTTINEVNFKEFYNLINLKGIEFFSSHSILDGITCKVVHHIFKGMHSGYYYTIVYENALMK